MDRRHLLAGIASVGTLGVAGAVASGGLPVPISGSSTAGDGESSSIDPGEQSGPVDPVTLDTIPAPGSRDGAVTIPAADQPTFVDFFGTWCPPCIEQMPALGEANERVGDRVTFVSVTTEAVGRSVTEAEVADWWREHEGAWLVAADPTVALFSRLGAGSFPTAVVLDASGRIHWSEAGVHSAETLVEQIEAVLP
jgi:thiol-disulfide isomerase/thioredoxin